MKKQKNKITVGKVIWGLVRLAILGLLIALVWMGYKVYDKTFNNQVVIEDDEYEILEEAIIQYGMDLNEIRPLLSLSQKEYDFFSGEGQLGVVGEAPEDTTHIDGVNLFVENIIDNRDNLEKQEAAKTRLSELMGDPDFIAGLTELELATNPEITSDEGHARAKVNQAGVPLLQISINVGTDEVTVQSAIGAESLMVNGETSLAQAVLNYLSENKDNISETKALVDERQASIAALWQDPEVVEITGLNSLNINVDPLNVDKGYEYLITDLEGIPLFSVVLNGDNGQFEMDAIAYEDTEALRMPLLEKLTESNGASEFVKSIFEKKEDVESLLASEAFKAGLDGLILLEAREEEGRVYYDLVTDNEAQEVVGSIIFDNATGKLSFIEAGDENEWSLEEILSGSKKKS